MQGESISIPHRGAAANLPNRFEKIHLEPDIDAETNPEEEPLPHTQFLKDLSQTIITYNDSPDIGFDAGINAYRGCEHGCIYCYARPTHEYLGFSAGLDFETRIMVKERAPELLRAELASPRWKPQTVSMSGVTDCYQPIERRLKLTRGCLEVFAEFRNPVGIVTKNNLVARDVDILAELAKYNAVAVYISVTTLDTSLRKIMEPRTSPPASRLATIEALARAGIPTGVLVSPIIPALNDHEIPKIIEAATKAGARYAGWVALRLPYAVAPLFEDWLARHFPDRKEKVLNQIRSMRGGKLYQADFATRMRGEGIIAEQISRIFHVACRKAGIEGNQLELSTEHFRRMEKNQLGLFD